MDELHKWISREGIKQTQIADWLGKTQAAVSKILSGKTVLRPNDARILIAKSDGFLNWEKIYGEGQHG